MISECFAQTVTADTPGYTDRHRRRFDNASRLRSSDRASSFSEGLKQEIIWLIVSASDKVIKWKKAPDKNVVFQRCGMEVEHHKSIRFVVFFFSSAGK